MPLAIVIMTHTASSVLREGVLALLFLAVYFSLTVCLEYCIWCIVLLLIAERELSSGLVTWLIPKCCASFDIYHVCGWAFDTLR